MIHIQDLSWVYDGDDGPVPSRCGVWAVGDSLGFVAADCPMCLEIVHEIEAQR